MGAKYLYNKFERKGFGVIRNDNQAEDKGLYWSEVHGGSPLVETS